jgi:hypothetical protein
MTPIKEIEKRLVEMEFKDFYRWIIINMHRLLEVDNKSTQKKSDDVSMWLYTHPRHTGSKY